MRNIEYLDSVYMYFSDEEILAEGGCSLFGVISQNYSRQDKFILLPEFVIRIIIHN